MAVIIQYIVVRDGVQKMTFATKKEADAYDKMLDIADMLYEFIETANLGIEEKTLEDLTFFLATNKEKTMAILRGDSPDASDQKKGRGNTKLDEDKTEKDKKGLKN